MVYVTVNPASAVDETQVLLSTLLIPTYNHSDHLILQTDLASVNILPQGICMNMSVDQSVWVWKWGFSSWISIFFLYHFLFILFQRPFLKAPRTLQQQVSVTSFNTHPIFLLANGHEKVLKNAILSKIVIC